jgi:hypothetical protein
MTALLQEERAFFKIFWSTPDIRNVNLKEISLSIYVTIARGWC